MINACLDTARMRAFDLRAKTNLIAVLDEKD